MNLLYAKHHFMYLVNALCTVDLNNNNLESVHTQTKLGTDTGQQQCTKEKEG